MNEITSRHMSFWFSISIRMRQVFIRDGLRLAFESSHRRLRKPGLLHIACLLSVTASASPNVVAWGENNYGQTNVPPDLTNAVAVAAGGLHSLGLRADGTVVAWGDNRQGQTNVPADLTNVVAIAAGGLHSLALKADGTVVAWGDNTYGQTKVPLHLEHVVTISAGWSHSLALEADGSVAAWGLNEYEQLNVPTGLANVVTVAAGDAQNLALRADGTVAAWGTVFGLEYGYPASAPTGLSNVVAISCGDGLSLVLRADGTTARWAWHFPGEDYWLSSDLSNVVAIAGGSLALRTDGTVAEVRGSNWTQQRVPVGLSNVVAIASGRFHDLALIGHGAPVPGPPQVERRVAQEVGTVIFYAPAVGGWPLSYQWQCNGTNVPSATNSWLLVTNALSEQAGLYYVRVSNAAGNVTAPVAHLSVVPAVFTRLLTDRVTYLGATFGLEPTVQGSEPFTYQWRFNGSELAGETNAALILDQVDWDNEGLYSILVSNRFGAVSSREAQLAVNNVAGWGNNEDLYSWGHETGQATPPRGLSNVVALAAGGIHGLALRQDGTVVAWGDDSLGQTEVPVGLTNVVAIAAGYAHNLALRKDGTVAAWGHNNQGQADVPTGLSNVVAVAAGSIHSLALRADGTILAWGTETDVPPGLSNVVAVAAGLSDHNLALRADGTVVAWGWSAAPVPSGLSNVTAIACGWRHALALRADGTVVAWGRNSEGQANVPSGLSNVSAIAAGFTHSLALRADGTVVAWGNNDYGQTSVPADLNNVAAIAAGDYHSLAVIAGREPVLLTRLSDQIVPASASLICQIHAVGGQPLSYQWHLNGQDLPGETNAHLILTNVMPSQAGLLSVTVSNAWGTATSWDARLAVVPALITQEPEDEVVFLGGTGRIEVRAQGGAEPLGYQWRFNGEDLPGKTDAVLIIPSATRSQDGTYSVVVSNRFGSVLSREARLAVNNVAAWGKHWNGSPLDSLDVPAGLSNAVGVAGGAAHSLALQVDGTVVAWGDNFYSQTTVPPELTNVISIAAGGHHSLALKADGAVVAWGDHRYGQTEVPLDLDHVVAISAGSCHSLALRADGTVAVWGLNGFGQTNVPSGLSNVVAIAAGESSCLALGADGTVNVWGSIAEAPSGLGRVGAVAAGAWRGLVLRIDGTVTGWGTAMYGDYGETAIPVGLSNVVAIAAGISHSLALRADGTVVAWGAGTPGSPVGWPYYGQSTIPLELRNVVAIAAAGHHSLALVGESPPARRVPLSSPSLSNGVFSVSLATRSGRVYALEFKEAITGSTWTALPLVAGTGRPQILADPTAPSGARYYRVREW
jgi:alpha-tubulin suppressor-like RCC1 family protein